MTRDELQNASRTLREASEAATDDDARERLYEQSDELARLATADRGPDHGRLARIERKLADAAEDAGDVDELVDEAIEHIHAYRESVEGV